MKSVNRTGKLLIAMLLFVAAPMQAMSGGDDPCAAFKKARIDDSMIAQMLEAAQDGYFYRIKPRSSKMGFCVDSPIGMVNAEFRNFTGGMALGSNTTSALVSIDAGSLKSDGFFIENMLKSDSFFDVQNFEDIVFVSTDFEWTGKSSAILKGKLTLRGVTRPVAFYVQIIDMDESHGDAERIMVKATTTVQRSQFGLYSLSSLVSDRVNLCMSVEAEKLGTSQARLDQDMM